MRYIEGEREEIEEKIKNNNITTTTTQILHPTQPPLSLSRPVPNRRRGSSTLPPLQRRRSPEEAPLHPLLNPVSLRSKVLPGSSSSSPSLRVHVRVDHGGDGSAWDVGEGRGRAGVGVDLGWEFGGEVSGREGWRSSSFGC